MPVAAVGPTVMVETSPSRTGWFRRPESERTGNPNAARFGTFRVQGLHVVQHPQPEVAARIDAQLLALAELNYGGRVVKRPGEPFPVLSDERPGDDEVRVTVRHGGPEILSVEVENLYRPAGAAQWTETTALLHFDLRTGQTVRWAELVRPADWPAVRAAALALFGEDVDVLLKAELAELAEWPEGYVAGGALWLLVRPVAGSAAGETGRFYPVPLGAVRGFLPPALLARFGSDAAAVPPPFWEIKRMPRRGEADEVAFVFKSNERGETALIATIHRIVPQLEAGEPEILEWTTDSELRLGLLHYFAGWVGTLDKYAVTRVAVIDLDTGKLLGCPPRSYTPVNGAPPVGQPVYRVEAGLLVVEGGEWGGSERFGG
jgi:hypothetical protein